MKTVLTILRELKDDEIKPSYELANNTGYSISAIETVIRRLRSLQLVESARGPHGGFKLTKHPEKIWFSELIPLCSKKNVLEYSFLIRNVMTVGSFFKIHGELLD